LDAASPPLHVEGPSDKFLKMWIRVISNSHKMRPHCNSRPDDCCVSRNIFRRCDVWQLKVGPYETLLRNQVSLAPGKTQT